VSSKYWATLIGPEASLSLCNWTCYERLQDAYHEQGIANPYAWREVNLRENPRFCVYCYQCGAALVTPKKCMEHGWGQCPNLRWELTETAASFVREYEHQFSVRRVPIEIWPIAEDLSMREPHLSGSEVAARFQVPPSDYPDDADWP